MIKIFTKGFVKIVHNIVIRDIKFNLLELIIKLLGIFLYYFFFIIMFYKKNLKGMVSF